MDEEKKPAETIITGVVKGRPFILTILCLIAFVYFFLLSALFFAGLLYSGWVTAVMNQYLPTDGYTQTQMMLIFGSGFLLHGFGIAGIVLIWRLRTIGYYFLGISCLIIAGYQLSNPDTAVSSTAIYIVFIFLFGLFYKRLH
jgi:hypothetical protein